MTRFYSLLFALLMSTALLAQSPPQSFSYQTVIRDDGFNVMANQEVVLRLSILEDEPQGLMVYQEKHVETTSAIGLVNLFIGEGNISSGSFEDIDWANHTYFLQVEIDFNGDNAFIIIGTSQLRSVPYALYALNAGNTDAGSVGPQGEQGIQGETGEQGLPGFPGTNGQDGNDGAQGVQGETGAQGPIGLTGQQGIQGETGEQGLPGFPGINGQDGEDGINGINGTQGVQGETGAQGPIGLTGQQGIQGETGEQGLPGFPGINGQDGSDGIDGIDAVVDYDSLANLISLDSSFAASVSSGIGGGGCDFRFPEGYTNDYFNIEINDNYIVPNGKRLYVTSSSSLFLSINGETFNKSSFNPLIINSGDQLTNYASIVGFFVEDSINNIQGINHRFNNGTLNFNIDNDKVFILTNLRNGPIFINGIEWTYLSDEYLILRDTDLLTVFNDNTHISGYLVDENYFANCGGGGSPSSTSSLDSAMVADLIAAAGGGCNIEYPDGFGIPLSFKFESSNNYTYTVPNGKRFYIQNIYNSPSANGYLAINSHNIYKLNNSNSNPYTLNIPLIINEGDVISMQTSNTENNSNCILHGFLVNSNNNIIPITNTPTNSGSPYVVPNGKKLIITNFQTAGSQIDIDANGPSISIGYGDLTSLGTPLMLNSTQQLEGASGSAFNGYLVDENYFAGCGGGGSSSSGASLDSTAIANMIASAISNSVSIGIGDYYGGGIVGYIFQPGDADYILGETHGYILYFDDTGIEWGCSGVTTNVVNNTIGQGPNNTQTLLNLCTESNFAAKWCNDLVVGPYNDWFLPTYEEAILIDLSFYLNLTNSSSYIQFWLSEEFAPNPNPYNYNCPSCSSASHAWAMYNISGTLDAIARLKINNQAGNIIAFRKF